MNDISSERPASQATCSSPTGQAPSDLAATRHDQAQGPQFEPCHVCGQYSHSIGDDAVADAFNHFQSMYAHPLRGHPMGYNFDEKTRSAAQVLLTKIRDIKDS